ncbi:hypothetical protein F7734_46385 [Scytonema sp. UIC 10036]|uniref:hypothetical protein n=1 Tax=Scytonema sp. UIC 10036 TaxID=2304196 RepID=UPI0012DA90BC|nr:hypothetical protein [Scytonema sp. UIC 10036]MUG99324.1 hypothetical protein [Scytonema sp. UIC 10036]
MQAKEIKDKLRSLIKEASSIDPYLATRLDEINRWIKDTKPGSLTAKKFVILFLIQIIRDADVLLKVKSLPSEQEQQLAFNELSPTLKYWYSHLLPKWLSKNDPKFNIWRQKLMAGEFNQEDANLIDVIGNSVKLRGGTFVQRYVADLSMATDIIVNGKEEKPLCIQLTSLSNKFFEEKFNEWESTLLFWQIERGFFLSYDPRKKDFVNEIVNLAMDNSERLKIGIYLKFNL